MTERSYILRRDKTGAIANGLFFGFAVFLSGVFSFSMMLQGKTHSFWFYAVFILFWFSLYSGVSTILGPCLLLFPLSPLSFRFSENKMFIRRRNGSETILAQLQKVQGSRTFLSFSGLTEQGKKVTFLIRKRSVGVEHLPKFLGELQRLLATGSMPGKVAKPS